MIVATRRLASFYKIVDLSSHKLSVELKELLEAGVSGDCCESILENIITCLRLEIMWSVHTLQESSTPNRVSVHGNLYIIQGEARSFLTSTDPPFNPCMYMYV